MLRLVLLCLPTLPAVIWLAGCATSPTGRSQLRLIPADQMAQMGTKSFAQIKRQKPVSKDPQMTRFVGCVVNALTRVVGPPPRSGGQWHVVVFKADDTVNAFALPGGNVGVYSGIFKVAHNQAQLATVVGHEIGHVEAGHADERLSTAYATQTGMQLLAALSGANQGANSQRIMALMGLGAQVGIILPFSRAQESEADQLGLRYMAKAGFDPHQAIRLWQNMTKASRSQPPQFLSDHPSNENRISDLKKHLPQAQRYYQQARAAGRRPDCGSAAKV